MIRTLAAALATSTFIVALATPAAAQTREYNIPAGSLKAALDAYSRQSGRQVVYRADEVRSARSPGVRGSHSTDAALAALLAGSGFTTRVDGKLVAIVKGGNGQSSDSSIVTAPDGSSPLTDGNQGLNESASAEDNEIVVTGTNIRGIAPESSPTKVFSREEIERSGAATAQEFISKLPENFGGGSNAAIPAGLPNDSAAGANSGGFGSYGSSVNLRGLGSGSTLVLLNGHRTAPASVLGDFVDISMIPTSAIKRVETLTDGASSIYGSDAVAGVVNFILRDDFDGLEASLRVGTGTQGGTPDQLRASLLAGRSWGGGNILAVYEHFNQDALSVADRGFARKDTVPNFLLPSQNRDSVFASLSQDITPTLTLKGDVLYSHRKSRQVRTDLAGGNTFQYDANSDVLNITASGSLNIGNGWYLDVTGLFGGVNTDNETTGITSAQFNQDRNAESDVWSVEAKLGGALFTLPAGDVRAAVGTQYRDEALVSTNVTQNLIDRSAKRKVYAAYGEVFVPLIAPENNFPAIQRFELNLSARYSDYSDFGSTFDPKVGILLSPAPGLKFRSSYSTSFKAPALGLVGATDFGASLFRTSYLFPIFRLTPADPSLADVVQLTVAGTDNDLEPETSRAFTAGVDFSRKWNAHSLTASATWFDINYKNRLGSIPIPGNVIHFDAINIAFKDPTAFPPGSFTFRPSREEIDDVLASLERPLGNPFGLNPYDTFFISRLLVVTNTSRTVARGIDFRLTYSYALADATLDLGLDGTYLKDFKRQSTASSPVVQELNTLFNPVDFKMRGRLGLSSQNVTAALFANYVDSYKTNGTPSATSVDSWTTIDFSLTLDTKRNLGGALFSNTAVRFSVNNLLDTDPPQIPFFATLRVDGYDATNASPLGRFISVELIKRF